MSVIWLYMIQQLILILFVNVFDMVLTHKQETKIEWSMCAKVAKTI